MQAAAMSLLLIMLSVSLSHAAETGDAWTYFEKKRVSRLSELSRLVYACVNRKDTRHPVFHGCVDWHSSVHGHWALLRASRYTGENRHREWVASRLSSRSMEKEREYLNTNKFFEMPYGRAWFLRLAIEHEKVTGEKGLRGMADDIAGSMMEYYRSNRPEPAVPEYRNAEWAFRNMYDYAVYTDNRALRKFVVERVPLFANSQVEFSFYRDREQPEFFSLYGNYLHLLQVTADRDTFMKALKANNISAASMLPVANPVGAHHLGMNYSRGWGLWSAYVVSNDRRFRDAYIKNIDAGYKLHESYRNDYHSYGHWVPQFGIYAISCSSGD